MMLTKSDLTQIKTVISEVVDDRLKKQLKPISDKLSTHEAKFDQIDKQFDKIDKRFEQVDQQFKKIDKRFGKIDKQFNKVNKDLKIIINYLDNNSLNHQTPITRIESQLGIVSS